MAAGRGYLLIGGAQFFVVFRAAAYFRGLLFTTPVTILRFAVSGLFGIVVIRAGGTIDRHPDLLLLPAFTVHPAIAQPKISWDMTRAYAEVLDPAGPEPRAAATWLLSADALAAGEVLPVFRASR